MSIWNPLNVFSSQRRNGENAAAAFDPSSTGDPIGAEWSRPAFGFGDTQVSELGIYSEPRRRPIGFAPPEETFEEQRYRTEISFKRHHETPRASAVDDQGDVQPNEPWQTPTGEHAFDSTPSPLEEVIDEASGKATDDVATSENPAEEKIPFFKREISFRRKQSGIVPAEEPADGVVVEEEPAEVELQVAEVESDPASQPEVFAVEDDSVPDDTDDEVAAAFADEPEFTAEHDVTADSAIDDAEAAVDETRGETPERVPFYKREVSFRRKTAAAVVAVEQLPAAAEEGEEVEAEGETELFASTEPEEASVSSEAVRAEVVDETPITSEAELVAEITEEEEAASLDEAEVAAQAEVVDEQELEVAEAAPDLFNDFDDEPHPEVEALTDEIDVAHDDLPAAAINSDEEVAAEHDLQIPVAVGSISDDDLFIEDTPEPAGRFSRKNRGADKGDKTPKRKQSGGGRNAKGRRVVGLKIGASQLAAAVVTEGDGGHELLELARRPLAAGIVVDGEVKDIDALANAVKAFFDDEKLPKKDVRIGIASNRIGVRTFDIVGVDDEARFDNAVRFKAHEVLPVAAHESVLDYRVLEERQNEAGEPSRRVLLVVAPRDQVEPYAEVASRAGLKLSGIDLEALGLLRAFVAPKPFAVRAVDDTATVVVSIGHESSTLLVAGGGACEFTRVFDWGGSALEEAIATALEVHPAEAATILRHLSLSGPGRQFDALDEIARAKAVEAVRLRLTPFARELVSSLQFYQTQTESLGIGGIVITGGTSHLEGLGDALHQMIGVNVSVGDPLKRVVQTMSYDPAIEAVIGSMAVPIGLAIDDIAMRSVNLLPREAVQTRSRKSVLVAAAIPVAVVVPLVAVGALYMGAKGKVSDRQAQLDAVQAEIATLPKPTGPTIDANVVGDEAARATAVASVLGGRVAWDSVFSDMARILPENVWLNALSVKQPEASVLADGTTAAAALAAGQAQPAPTGVSIEGYTYSQTDVARLLARLATLPSLQRVTLTTSAKAEVAKKNVIRFVIVADLSQTGGAS